MKFKAGDVIKNDRGLTLMVIQIMPGFVTYLTLSGAILNKYNRFYQTGPYIFHDGYEKI
jgi:hypothetical protein